MRTVINEQGFHRGLSGEGLTIEGSKVDVQGNLIVKGVDILEEIKRFAELLEELKRVPQEIPQITAEPVEEVVAEVTKEESTVSVEEVVEAPVVEKPVSKKPFAKKATPPTV